MALSDSQMQEMDNASGLSTQKFQEMDNVANGTNNPSSVVPATPDKGFLGGASSVMRSLGLGAIPDIAGGLTSLPNEIGNTVDTFTGKKTNAQALQSMRDQLNQNAFMPDNYGTQNVAQATDTGAQMKQKMQSLTNDMQSTPLNDTAGALSWMLPGTDLLRGGSMVAKGASVLGRGALRGGLYATSQGQPTNIGDIAGGSLLEPLSILLHGATSGKLTIPGLNKAYEAAHNAASGKGLGDSNLMNFIEQELNKPENQFVSDTVKQDARRIVQAKTPASVTVGENQFPATILEEAPPFQGGTRGGEQYVRNSNGELELNPQNGQEANIPKGATATGIKTVSKMGNGTTMQEPQLNSQQLHNLRQEIDKTINWKSLQNTNVRPEGVRANLIARSAISNAMHSLAPDTAKLDQLYKLYNNPFFSKTLGNRVGLDLSKVGVRKGVPTALVNVLTGLGIGDVGLKKIFNLGL